MDQQIVYLVVAIFVICLILYSFFATRPKKKKDSNEKKVCENVNNEKENIVNEEEKIVSENKNTVK